MPRSPEQIRLTDTHLRAAELGLIARHLLQAGDMGHLGALEIAQKARSPERVVAVLKTAVEAGTLTDWGAPLAEMQAISDAFLSLVQQVSFFDRMAVDAVKMPANTKAVIASGGACSIVDEAAPAPAMQLVLETSSMARLKAQGFLVLNQDLLRLGGQRLESHLNIHMRNLIAAIVNEHFLSIITPSGSPDPTLASSGDAATNVHTDIAALLAALTTDAFSRVHLALSPKICKQLCTLSTTDGATVFPQMRLEGGIVCGLPATACNTLQDDEVVAVDASRFAVDVGEIRIDRSDQTSVEFETSPTNPPGASTVLRSLWQNNQAALRIERRFAFKQLTDNAVAKMADVDWGAGS